MLVAGYHCVGEPLYTHSMRARDRLPGRSVMICLELAPDALAPESWAAANSFNGYTHVVQIGGSCCQDGQLFASEPRFRERPARK